MMKKIFVVINALLLSLFLIACSETNSPKIYGAQSAEINIGESFDPLEGVIATDSVDKDLTPLIILSGDTVDVNTVGSYEVIYSVTNSANKTTTVRRIVKVVDKTAAFNNTTEHVTFINFSEEFNIDDGSIDLYYFDGKHLPYVVVSEFIRLLDGVYYSDEFEYVIDKENEILTLIIDVFYEFETTQYSLTIDAKNDTLSTPSLDFFYVYLMEGETNFSEGIISLDPIVHEGSEVLFDLSLYDFDIKYEDNKFLMPLVIANLFFNMENYFDVYYNGVSLFGIDTSDYSNPKLNYIISSKYNYLDEPEDIKVNNYNYYRLLIDYFYGLKEDLGIINSEDFIDFNSFMNSGSDRSILNTTIKLDELHSSHLAKGFYKNRNFPESYNNITDGPRVGSFYSELTKTVTTASYRFGTTLFGYLDLDDLEYEELSNDTVIIYVLNFYVETPNGIEEIIESLPSRIEHVIIDLSLNTGGNLGAVLRMFALMTDEEIWYHYKNPLSGEKVSYGVVGEKDAYDNFTYSIKTSAVTFSAANLSASIAKELGIKVIGTKSSGGASGISFFVFPNGAIVNLSSNMVLTDSNYNSIEYGITPDVILGENNLYNNNLILEAIKYVN